MSDPIPTNRAPVSMGEHGIQLRTMDDLGRWCVTVAKSGMAPRGMDTPEKIAVAVQTGMEAGISPMASLRSIVVINGTPSWKGEAALALIRSRGICKSPPRVFVRGDGDAREGVFAFHRADMAEPVEVTFSVADAKRAKLWGKAGPWTEYSEDMLCWRAVGRGSKRYFSDVLQGIAVAEEVQDYPPDSRATVASTTTAPADPDPLLASGPTQEEIDAEFVADEKAVEIDPATGEVIPEHVGQGSLL